MCQKVGLFALYMLLFGLLAPVSAESAWRVMHKNTIAPTIEAAASECRRHGVSATHCARFRQMLERGECLNVDIGDDVVYASMSTPSGVRRDLRKELGGPTPALRCHVATGVTIDWYNRTEHDCNNVGVVKTQPACKPAGTVTRITPGSAIALSGLDVCNCVDLPGLSVRISPTITRSTELGCE